jgi:hypothetical protein
MRALSFLQPWLQAVLHLGKNVENRKWKPPEAMVGQVFALHASKGWDKDGEAFIVERHSPFAEGGHIVKEFVPRGAVIGAARLLGWSRWQTGHVVIGTPTVDLVFIATSPWFFGPYGWLLGDIVELPRPVPCKGALGFWKMPADVEAEVERQLASKKATVP